MSVLNIYCPLEQDDLLLGNLTVMTPADNEQVLNMEKFDGLLTNIECNPDGMSLTFEDSESFAYAQGVWDWVNGADDHEFLMVAGRDDCHEDGVRTPYLVQSIAYDAPKNTAHLVATPGTFTQYAHTYSFQVGSVPIEHNQHLFRRDFSRDTSVSLDHDLSFSQDVPIGPVTATIACEPCSTSGQINLQLNVEQTAFVPTGLTMRVAPAGVQAKATLKLSATAEFTQPIAQEIPLPEIPIAGFSIPGNVFSLGPVLETSIGFELASLSGSISVTTGATLSIPDDSFIELNALNPSENSFQGWQPQITPDPINVEARVETSAEVNLSPNLLLQIEVLGRGVEAGINTKLPFIRAELAAVAATAGGACAEGDELGITVTPSIGFEIGFTAGFTGEAGLVDVELASGSTELGGPLCIGADILGGGDEAAAAPPADDAAAAPPADEEVAAAPEVAPAEEAVGGGEVAAAEACEIDTGIAGECVDVAACSGVSTPGFCPGAANIQCCTA